MKKFDWNLDAEEAILFLDWCVKANYAIGPTGGIPDWIANGEDAEISNLIQGLKDLTPPLAQDNLLEWAIKFFRSENPEATEDDLHRFILHVGAYLVIDAGKNDFDYWREKHKKDRQAVSDVQIREVMNKVDGNKSAAAKALGISRSQLYERLKKIKL